MTDRIEVKAQLTATETGEITGLAWPFGTPDRVGDIIAKGAFDRPASLPMLFAHDQGQVIGVWEEIAETAEGLSVKGRLLVNEVERAREVRAMIRSGAIRGLSIGFQTHKAQRLAKGRRIDALTLHEISVVAVPCHPDAQITALKAANLTTNGDTVENEDLTPAANAQPSTPANDAPGLDLKAFADMRARLDNLEAKAQRPGAVMNATPLAGDDERKSFVTYVRTGAALDTKALNYAGATSGAVLAPDTTARSILEKVAEFSPVRSIAQVIGMGGPLLQLPVLVDEVTPEEVAETADRPEDEPSFAQIDLRPHEMAVTVPVSRILLEDAQINLDAYLTGHIGRRFGQTEARWFVRGNGVSQAEGLLVNTDIAVTDTTVSNFADGLIDCFYSVKTAYASRGAWLLNRAGMALVRKLRDTDGTHVWQPALAAGQPPTILGRPVYEAPDLDAPTAGGVLAVFGDFHAGYAVADRVGLSVLRDEYTAAANGIVKLHARRRVGGRVLQAEALHKLRLAV